MYLPTSEVSRFRLAMPLAKLSARLLLLGREAGTLRLVAPTAALGAVQGPPLSVRQSLRLRLPLKSLATPQLPVVGSFLTSETCRSCGRPATTMLLPATRLFKSSAHTKALLLKLIAAEVLLEAGTVASTAVTVTDWARLCESRSLTMPASAQFFSSAGDRSDWNCAAMYWAS